MTNSLRSKYLSGPKVRATPWSTGPVSDTVDKQGYLRPVFVCVGLYYCSAIDQFGESEDGIVDPLVDGIGRTWRLVSSNYVNWMAGMLEKAFESDQVSSEELSAGILKFYRVRDRLEMEMSAKDSNGDQHSPGGAGEAGGAGGAGEEKAA